MFFFFFLFTQMVLLDLVVIFCFGLIVRAPWLRYLIGIGSFGLDCLHCGSGCVGVLD